MNDIRDKNDVHFYINSDYWNQHVLVTKFILVYSEQFYECFVKLL